MFFKELNEQSANEVQQQIGFVFSECVQFVLE
jgi:hypothetical protein